MPGAPASIFISYSRRDSSFVDKLEADLRVRHFSTWVDRRKIESTPSWKRVLQDAIDQYDTVLVVLSPASITSPNVQMEYGYALRKGKPLLALECQPCPALPADLQGVPRIAFHTSYRQGLSKLLLALNGAESDPPSKPAPVGYLEQARQAQNARKWRQAAGFWQALLEVDPRNSEARQCLEQSLREQGRKANASGAWEQAISAWEVLLKLNPDDAQATRQLPLAQRNQSYMQYYQDAQQFIVENQPTPASTQLRLLWQYAPYYGDPEGLALKAGVTKPLRSPATLDREEEEKLAKARKEREEREARERARGEEERRKRQKQEADERERARLAEEQRKREKQEADERERAWKEAEALEQERLAKLKQQQAEEDARLQQEWEAAEQLRLAEWHLTPGGFIQDELDTTRGVVWSSFFFLLSGLGAAVGIVTQSVFLALVTIAITAIVAYLLGYHRTIHRAGQNTPEEEFSSPSANEAPQSMLAYAIAPLVIVIICCLITFFFVNYLSQLRYNVELTGQFLGFTRSWWPGRQIKAGLAIGAILSLIIVLGCEPWKGLSAALRTVLTWGVLLSFFLSWLVCELFAFFIDWGWGLGDSWELGLLGLIVGVIGGTGLASSFVIWVKGKPIF